MMYNYSGYLHVVAPSLGFGSVSGLFFSCRDIVFLHNLLPVRKRVWSASQSYREIVYNQGLSGVARILVTEGEAIVTTQF